MPARAIVFDFNGTLSDDEPILCEIYVELFAEYGEPLSAQEYFDRLAGHSDEEIAMRGLGRDDPRVGGFVRERIERYRARVSDGATIHEPVRAAVRYAAERAPLAIVSGAARTEIEPVLEAAAIAALFRGIVSADDVDNGKPDPEGYLRVLGFFEGLEPQDVLVFEDTEAGVASAKAAGMRVFGIRGTLDPARLRAADELVDRIDVDLVRRVLG
jgi:beta-phosphoglucomutase